MGRRSLSILSEEIKNADFKPVKKASDFSKKWGWQGWILDTIAKGDRNLFNDYLAYPWIQILMMGVKEREKQDVMIAEHEKRKAESKNTTSKGRSKVRTTPKGR